MTGFIGIFRNNESLGLIKFSALEMKVLPV